LFEVGDIGEVDLRREVATERRAEAFGVTEWSTGERPGAFEGLASALPQQRVQVSLAYLKDRGEHLVAEVTRVLAGRFGVVLTDAHSAW
jgi:hypothetical protein